MPLQIRVTLPETGEQKTLVNPRFQPMTLSDLVSYRTCSSPLDLHCTGDLHLPDGSVVTVDAKGDLTLGHGNTCFALVEGGWLPPALALPGSVVLADGNMVSEICERFAGGELDASRPRSSDFIDLFATGDLRFKLNLAPYALENNHKRSPSRLEVIERLDEATHKIKAALPKLELIPVNSHLVDGIMGIIEDTRGLFQKRKQFLFSCSHLILNTVGRAGRTAKWMQIAELADHAELPRDDLCVVAAISSATSKVKFNPARKVLKPKAHYREEVAHNALCDLRLMSILLHIINDFPSTKAVVLTQDVPLAGLWSGLSPWVPSKGGQQVRCDFKVSNTLLPIDRKSAEELIAILQG